MRTIQINDVVYQVDARLEAFTLTSKKSSMVAFFGYSLNNSFFIQFQNGSSYIVRDVDETVLAGINKADSIGKYYNAHIKGKFPSEKLTGPMVVRKEMVA